MNFTKTLLVHELSHMAVSIDLEIIMFQLSYLDPCAGVACSGGLTAVANLGICQCLCGSSAATAIGISLPSNANVCADGVAKCGTTSSNVAKCTGATPMCLSSTTPGATPALGGAASCQVILWSCIKSPNSN